MPIIRHHDEYYSWGGYLDNLKGDNIPLLSRIIKIFNFFDAIQQSEFISLKRPMKKPS